VGRCIYSVVVAVAVVVVVVVAVRTYCVCCVGQVWDIGGAACGSQVDQFSA
jgi:hypothetical protein